jgi:flagellar biogenesis protein FliO
MPPIIVISSLILAALACAPAAAQTYPTGNVPERETRGLPSYMAPTAPQPTVYPSPPPTGLNDSQVRPAVFEQPPTRAAQDTRPATTEPAASGGPSDKILLSPPGHKYDAATAAGHSEHSGMPSPLTVAGSLAFVLGLFFLVAWVMRRATPGAARLLPKEVVEVLGRAPLASRHQMHLLRCGHKLLLVCATPAGVETLTEITDPLEVDRVAGLCQQTRPDSATTMFRQVFAQLADTPHPAPRRTARHVDEVVELANAGIPGSEPEGVEDRHGRTRISG